MGLYEFIRKLTDMMLEIMFNRRYITNFGTILKSKDIFMMLEIMFNKRFITNVGKILKSKDIFMKVKSQI